MKRLTLLLLTIVLTSTFQFAIAQNTQSEKTEAYKYLSSKGEVYFSFELSDRSAINELSVIISIDNIKENIVYAYANKDEFEKFLQRNINFKVLPHPGDVDFDLNMKSDVDVDNIQEWDFYPTYEAYVAMMTQFSVTYPNLCRIVNAGTTVQGRQILFAVISDNVNTAEAEPKFMYTSSMHGDETTAYILMLRLIDYLLSRYTTDPKVSSLVNNIEIWINPDANPDGTYRGGNGTVNGAVRYNANNYDLNRNFPAIDYPNTAPIQPETQSFMNLADANYFRLSANFHGGAEVLNYPWDSWQRLTADDAWWVRVCRKYADTVHSYAPSTYLDDYHNGIVNGYEWYYTHGSRQDYQTYFKHGREVTIEISNTKLLPPAQLPAHWNYNYRSLLNFIEQTLYGITGTVTDSATGLPLKAKVSIAGFDMDSSEVYSDSLFGKYYRMIIQGTYVLTYSAPGYYSKTISNINAVNDNAVTVNVPLRPIISGIAGNGIIPLDFSLYQNYPNPFNPATVIAFDIPNKSSMSTIKTSLIVYDVLGREVASLVNKELKPGMYKVEWKAVNYPSGIYIYELKNGDFAQTRKMVLIK